ncbi:MAG: hypothetical protein P4L83_01375 [Nevskia sp.]|nr:hypothetical protein [Nevskia sp.]
MSNKNFSPRRSGGLRASARRQRGAAAIYAGVMLIAMIASALLAINVGQLYFAQQDLQKQASLAALAGAEIGSGCRNGGIPGGLGEVSAKVAESLNNNASKFTSGAALLSKINGAQAVALGQLVQPAGGLNTFVDLSTGVSGPVSAETNPNINAVRVNVSRPFPSLIGNLFAPPGGTLKASATAYQPAWGNFYVTTGLAAVTTNNSPLLAPVFDALLGLKSGSGISAAVLAGGALANAQITLRDLEIQAGVNNLNDLVNLGTNLSGAVKILGDATSGAAGGLISGLAGKVYNGGGGPTQKYFGQVLNDFGGTFNPTVTDLASAQTFVNAQSLLIALGEAASVGQTLQLNITSPLVLPKLNSGNTHTTMFLKVFAPAQFSPLGPPGPMNTAHSEQLEFDVRFDYTQTFPSGLLKGSSFDIYLGTNFSLASGTGTLTSLSCPSAANPKPTAYVDATTQVGKLTMGSFTPSTTSDTALGSGNLVNLVLSIPILGINNMELLDVALANNDVQVDLGDPGSHLTGPYNTYLAGVSDTTDLHPHNYTYIPDAPDNKDTIASSAVLSSAVRSLFGSLGNKDNLKITLFKADLSAIVDPVLSAIGAAINPLVTLMDGIIEALLQLLGVQFGDTTVVMNKAYIGQPVIVSTALPVAAPAAPNAVASVP